MKYSVFCLAVGSSLVVASCGSGVEQTTIAARDSVSEKAVYTTLPVYRFAKTTGAYFYTGSAVEAELIRLNYPDFRYEGVAFNQVTSGNGQKVYRFANLTNGGYFYTASEAEKNYVLTEPSLKVKFRLDDASFFVAPDNDLTGQPVFRAANRSNGAYLYSRTRPEILYAVNVIGTWNDEGLAFRAPDVPTVNPSWTIPSFSAYTLYSGFGTTDSIPATVNEQEIFAVGTNRYTLINTTAGCTSGNPSAYTCNQQLEGQALSICVKGAQTGNTNFFKGKHVLASAASVQVPVSELAGKSFTSIEDCVANNDTFTFNADGTAQPPNSPVLSAANLANTFGTSGYTSPDGSKTTISRAYKVQANGGTQYFFIEEGKPATSSANTYVSLWKQK
jgi:hypothetical protein